MQSSVGDFVRNSDIDKIIYSSREVHLSNWQVEERENQNQNQSVISSEPLKSHAMLVVVK